MNHKLITGAGLLITWAAWLWVAGANLNQTVMIGIALAGTLGLIPIVLVARWLLDHEPTIEKAHQVTTYLHFAIAIFLGSAIIVATRFALLEPVWHLAIPRGVGIALMFISSLLLLGVVLNLALKGLGAPFAAALTRLVATEWFYAWTRNPMVLAGLALLLGIGLWLQSGLYLLWLVIFVTPAIVVFLLLYEERELEIRFGQDYLNYKSKTPGFFPRRPQ